MTRLPDPRATWFLSLISMVLTPACSEADGRPRGPEPDGTAGAGGSSAPGGSGGSGASITVRGRCPAGGRSGDFSVVREPELTAIRGQLWDRASSSRVLSEVARAGDCWLTRSEPTRCSPACSGTETCDAGGQCVVAPLSRSAGRVRISGLAQPVEMSPLMPGNNYFVAGDFPARAFEPGSAIELVAEGDEVAAFSLHGVGVEPLELPSADWIITKGKAFVLSWSPGAVPVAIVRVSLNVDQHGGAPVNLSCETADDGELQVESELVDALLEAGVTGFPSGHVQRETVDSVAVSGGCVELAIGTHVRRGLSVEGYVPCMKAGDCPDGTTCNTKLQRCE